MIFRMRTVAVRNALCVFDFMFIKRNSKFSNSLVVLLHQIDLVLKVKVVSEVLNQINTMRVRPMLKVKSQTKRDTSYSLVLPNHRISKSGHTSSWKWEHSSLNRKEQQKSKSWAEVSGIISEQCSPQRSNLHISSHLRKLQGHVILEIHLILVLFQGIR